MISKSHLIAGFVVIVILAGLFIAVVPGFASGGDDYQQFTLPYAEGQMIIQLLPESTEKDLEAVNRKYGGKILRKLPVPNTYLVKVPSVSTPSASGVKGYARRPLSYYMDKYASRLKIKSISPEYRPVLFAEPNDPRYRAGDMWGLIMIGMPRAWDIQKGSSAITVAVLDNGCSPNHPDLASRLVPGWDTADNDPDTSPSPTDSGAGHGTHVAGTIAAVTDNGIGVAGVCWSGVRVMPIKVFKDIPTENDSGTTAVIDGLDYAMNRGAQVVNMSLGWPGGYRPSDALWDKIKELNSRGIIIVCAAGNEYRGPVSYPAAYPECIAVSALGPTGSLAPYSNVGSQIDISAPGGDMSLGVRGGIISTYWTPPNNNTYEFLQGTSMASPHVAGAAALLLSAGIHPSEVKTRLFESATPAGTTSPPNIEYGWGILNVAKAFSGEIKILKPEPAEEVETSTPTFSISVKRVDLDSINVYVDFVDLDDDGKPDIGVDETPVINVSNYLEYYDSDAKTISFTWPIGGRDPLTPGKHKIYVSAYSGVGSEVVTEASAVFFVKPRIQSAGWRMFSLPYEIDSEVTPESLFGSTGFLLARYVPAFGRYATYPAQTSSSEDPSPLPSIFASFDPPDAMVRPHRETFPTPPRGIGYWLYLTNEKSVLLPGTADLTKGYDIDIHTGWNMVGNPFPFRVDWNNVIVRYQGRTATLAEAVSRQWISGTIFRYGINGYISQTAPAGVIVPWEAFWIRARGDTATYGAITLTIPPIPSQAPVPGSLATRSFASLSSATTTSVNKGWKVNIIASTSSAVDNRGAIGQQVGASNKFGSEDIESPPLAPEGVDLYFPHSDWGSNSGAYDEDIRAWSLSNLPSWHMCVTSARPYETVTLTWQNLEQLPAGYSLILTDELTGETLTLSPFNRYTYTSAEAYKPRQFTIKLAKRFGQPFTIKNAYAFRQAFSIAISYNLTNDAAVSAVIRDQAGKVVRKLPSISQKVGKNTLFWNLRLDNGKNAPKGSYAITIEGRNAFGETAYAACGVTIK